MTYDTIALTEREWDERRVALLADGWEYRLSGAKPPEAYIYARKHIDGDLAEKEWLTA